VHGLVSQGRGECSHILYRVPSALMQLLAGLFFSR